VDGFGQDLVDRAPALGVGGVRQARRVPGHALEQVVIRRALGDGP